MANEMINWRFRNINGVQVLDLIVLKISKRVKVGKYGIGTKIIYKVLERGDSFLQTECTATEFSIEESANGKKAAIKESFTQLGSLEIPIACGIKNDRNLLTTIPPFLNTANLSVKLPRKQSELDEVQHRINFPVPVREGAESEPNLKAIEENI